MILLRVVGLVKDEQIYLPHRNERVSKAVSQDLRCANDYHVLCDCFLPCSSIPRIATQISPKATDLLVKIAIQYGILLKDECNGIDLESSKKIIGFRSYYQKERDTRLFPSRTRFELLIDNMSQEQDGNKCLP